MTAALQQCLESVATIPGISFPQKGLQGGYTVETKRDKQFWALFVRTSHCGVETA